jgi:hypothetical protein
MGGQIMFIISYANRYDDSGPLEYVDGATANDGFWRLNISNFLFSGNSQVSLTNTQFILDTGSPTTTLPTNTIQDIADAFQGIVTNGFAVVPCGNIENQNYTMTFSQNAVFTMSLANLADEVSEGQCQIALEQTSDTPTLGANLLSKFYTVWQVESNTIGLAIAATSPVSAEAVAVQNGDSLPQANGVATE